VRSSCELREIEGGSCRDCNVVQDDGSASGLGLDSRCGIGESASGGTLSEFSARGRRCCRRSSAGKRDSGSQKAKDGLDLDHLG
jgi:hypothetical protein